MESIDDIWSRTTKELRRGTVDTKHPYRYGTLATTSETNGPAVRTVVIREIIDELAFLIYTDTRTQKVTDVKSDDRVSLLFYHPKKREQIRITGTAMIIEEGPLFKEHKNKISEHGRRDYNSHSAPGSRLESEEIQRENNLHFALLQILPKKIDFLKIERPEHIRIQYECQDSTWIGHHLVP